MPYLPWIPAQDRRALVEYRGIGKELVRAYKFEGRKRMRLAWAFLFVLGLEELILERGVSLWEDLVVVPVPSSAYGLWKRGFDPVFETARVLESIGVGRMLRVFDWGEGGSQKVLTREERLAKRTAFRLRAKETRALSELGVGNVVCLIDDVMTTGATLDGASEVLRRLYSGPVHALALAQD